MIKKVLYSIFICLASFFLMSHNVSAMNLSNAGTYGIQCNRSQIQFLANSNSQSMYNVGNACEVVAASDLVKYRFTGFNIYLNVAIPAHSIFNVSGQISGASINGSFNGFSGGSQFSIYQQNITALDGNGLYFSITGITGNSAVQNFNFSTGADYIAFFGSGGRFAVQPVSFVATSGGSDYSNSINGITNILNDLRTQNNDIWNMLNNLNNNTDNVNNNLGEVKGAIENLQQQQQQQLEQEKQDTNNAIDDSKNSSNSSSSDVQNNSSTQSLLSVITGFFGAITSASPSSCVLTGQINEYLTPSFDLCQLDPPPALTALLSIPVAIALFFFAKHMLNKIIALIRSFQ